MTIYISEHARASFGSGRATSEPLASYQLSTLSTQRFPGVGARLLRIVADANSLFSQTTTVSTGVALSSTNAARISANAAPEFFTVVSTATNLVGSVSTS